MKHRYRIAYLGNFSVPYSTENDMASAMETIGHEVRRIQEGQPWDQILYQAVGAEIFWWTQTKSLADKQPIEDRVNGITDLSLDMPTVATHLDLWFGLGREDQLRAEPYFRCRHVFSADGDHDDEFAALGINHHWLPPAVNYDECRFIAPRPEYQRDVAFVGGWDGYGHEEWRPSRDAMLDRLRRDLGERFECWPLRGQPAVRQLNLNALMASTKIIIGDSCFATTARWYVSDRYFETVGRGGFLLAPAVPALVEMLEPQAHAVYFEPGNLDDMMDGVRFWLDHDERRELIRERGMRYVRANHTYVNRVEQVIDTLREEGDL